MGLPEATAEPNNNIPDGIHPGEEITALWVEESFETSEGLIEGKTWYVSDSNTIRQLLTSTPENSRFIFDLADGDQFVIELTTQDEEPLESGVFASEKWVYRVNHAAYNEVGELYELDVDIEELVVENPRLLRFLLNMPVNPDEAPFIPHSDQEMQEAYSGTVYFDDVDGDLDPNRSRRTQCPNGSWPNPRTRCRPPGRRSVKPENETDAIEPESVAGSRSITISVPLNVPVALLDAGPVGECVTVLPLIAPELSMHAIVFARPVAIMATIVAPIGAVVVSAGIALLPVLAGIAASIGRRRGGAQTGP